MSLEKLVQLIFTYYLIASVILSRELKMFVPKSLLHTRINVSKK